MERSLWSGNRWLARYGMAVVVVAVAVAVRVALVHVLELRSPFLLLFAAVVLSAAYGGLGPGVLATALAALCSALVISHPRMDVSEFSIFFLEGLFVSLVGAMFYRARRRLETADVDARRLEQKILEIGEGERRRIGHDLHDGLGQHLTGIALLTKALRQRLAALKLPEAEQAARVGDLVNQSIGWTRDLARGLSPVTLDSDGLQPALLELAENASGLLGIDCTCEFDPTAPTGEDALDGETCLHLYRIAQEAINNSVKHGKARHVRIGLRQSDGVVKMTVTDDGSGLSAKTRINPGIGLQIMQYRARMIGAHLVVERWRGEDGGAGTVVTCALPVGRDGSAGRALRSSPPSVGVDQVPEAGELDVQQHRRR